jgi:ribose 5-phosphate isomerase B
MRIAIGSDERTSLTDAVLTDLEQRGHTLLRIGPLADSPLGWPEVARKVGEAVASGEADEGILFCWTGTGVSMAANKIPGIRAALCDDAETAHGARLWNNANVLCMSLRRTPQPIAKEILEAWFATSYQPNPEDDASLEALAAIEQRYRKAGSSLSNIDPHSQT